jgi:L-threonylcarbamoyladenylate synthase
MVDFEIDIKNCVEAMNKDGTILYPTDTIWGIGCDATNEEAVEKVFALKQRPKNKSMIILLAEAKDILQFIASPPPDIIDIVENFETPTTIIFDGALELAENVLHEDGSVAIRVVNEPFCKAMIKRFGKPIVSTSANVSGEPNAAFFKQINPAIVAGADYVVQHRRDDETPKQPSRIIKVDDEGAITIIRP